MSGTKICPQCGTRYEGGQRFCSLDGATLVAEHPADTLTGSVLADRYVVREKLGEGGMGEVYLAEHVRMKRKVAVKVMRKWLTSDPAAIGRFHREAENASQITHPNVAAVYDFGETSDGLVYLAMEFVAGESLTRILQRERVLNHIRASDIVSQVADALAAAHSLGILHRDLKPDNVMIGKTRVGTDQVKLLDFGIARVMGRETQHFTSTGLIVGTPDWMSPEQISGDQLDARADIYALGLIGYRMLTGEGAFGGGSSSDLLLAKMTRPPRRLGESRADLAWPDALQGALDRALASNPADRYGDALAFARDFFYAISQLPMTPEAELYLGALSQRAVTPTRGMGSVELTPPRPLSGLSDATPPSTSGVSAAHGAPATPEPLPVTTARARASDAVTAPLSLEELAEAPTVEGSAVGAVVASSGESTAIFGGAATAPPPRGRRPLLSAVVGGAVLLIAALALWNRGGSKGQPADGLPNATSKAAASLDTTQLLVVSATPITDTMMAIDSVLQRSTPGVFGVVGSRGRGAGFLADSSGIVLTSASFVRPNDTASVFIDGSRKLLARVLDVDSARGVAAMLIPINRCTRCTALRLAADSVLAKVGDSVVAIGAPTLVGPRSSVRGTLSSMSDSRLVASFRSSERRVGGPVLRATGAVVGFNRTGAGSSANIAPIAAARELLARANQRRTRIQPIDSVPPTWPTRSVPAQTLKEAEGRADRQSVDDYSAERDGFAVLVMTPQTMAWRHARADSLRKQGANPFAIGRPTCPTARCDPIENWASWAEYRAERRAVVVVQVSPVQAKPPFFGTPAPIAARRNFRSLALTRDGAAVAPIEGARIYAVANPEDYGAARRTAPFSGIYVFAPSAFVGARTVVLNVFDESDPGRAVQIELPARLLTAVATDLAPYTSR